MAICAIGDIQGCFTTLERLLRRLGFDARRDRLHLVGDLVNRGPRSLDVLRWAMAQGDAVRVVLGNHDLHLIRRYLGIAEAKRRDTLEQVLAAPDAAQLVGYLRSQPFVRREGGCVLVHAGFLPEWSVDDALRMSADASRVLAGAAAARLLGDDPAFDALRAFVRTVTNIRVCDAAGNVDFSFSDAPELARPPFVPWYSHPHRRSRSATVVFGHWSARGLYRGDNVFALDTGCVWGGSLTALDLDSKAIVQEPAADVENS